MNRLVLIDGNAILHRAYHALPPLTAPDGSVVNAVYGFTSMLLKIFHDFKPTHMAVAFDRPEPTFRKTLFIGYQATRPKMEDALVSQIPKVQDVVRSFGIPIFEAAGFEADDIIGTVAKQAISDKQKVISKTNEHSNLSPITSRLSPSIDEVIIVTGDKDILQLVDDGRGVKVFMPTKGLSEGKLYGEAEVVEKMGVTPKHIPDLKALMGDPSDNYPGISGIGPKTAVKLLADYGSVERLLKSKKLNDSQNARLGLTLATIRTDAPIEINPFAPLETLDTVEARKKLQELHFPSLLKRLAGPPATLRVAMRAGGEKKPKEKKTEQQELF